MINTNKVILFLLVLFFMACKPVTNQGKNGGATITPADRPDFSVALKFINDYIDHLTRGDTGIGGNAWIARNSLLTESFKTRYRTILDSAQKGDPELGLGFDPILDAQDYPEEGFESVKSASALGYITVAGKKWKAFNLVLKLVSINNRWLVDGSGIINVAPAMRAPRER